MVILMFQTYIHSRQDQNQDLFEGDFSNQGLKPIFKNFEEDQNPCMIHFRFSIKDIF